MSRTWEPAGFQASGKSPARRPAIATAGASSRATTPNRGSSRVPLPRETCPSALLLRLLVTAPAVLSGPAALDLAGGPFPPSPLISPSLCTAGFRRLLIEASSYGAAANQLRRPTQHAWARLGRRQATSTPIYNSPQKLGKMPKVKRRAKRSNGRQKFPKLVKEVSSNLRDCEFCWDELSQELATKLSPIIVSLASFDGDKMHYKSTGIVIENNSDNTCFLTSSALIRTTDSERRFIPALKIKLRLPNNQVVDGWIQQYNLPFSMILITAGFSPDLRTACFSNSVQVEPCAEFLAVKRCFESGKLMVTRGAPTESLCENSSEGFKLSTCRITMDGSGGPLVDCDGNIVGMNVYHDHEMTRYVQRDKICGCLKDLQQRMDEMKKTCMQNFCSAFRRHLEGSSNENGSSEVTENNNQELGVFSAREPQAQEFTEDEPRPELTVNEHKHLRTLDPWPSDGFTKPINDVLRSDGYPVPAYADGGMCLKGDFEEEFGRHILTEPARRVALKMSRSVVALASFNGNERHFACTGVFIDCNESTTRILTSASLVRTSGDENKIVDNLKIQVCLPSKVRIEGILRHHDFCYNVAVVSITKFHNNRAATLVESPQTKVVALGRVFKSGNFMATDGLVTSEQDKYDCKELKISTCKITKAGIGGPLFDLNGNFVGMNFYDMEGTPYLPSNIILKVLRDFNPERTVATGTTEKPTYSWPVPKPYWYYPRQYRGRNQPRRTPSDP